MKPPLPLHIDSTMLTAFRSCPQKFKNEFILGRRPAALSIDLHAGACFASAIENVAKHIYVDNEPLPLALSAAHARFLFDWGDFEIPEHKRTAKTRERMWDAVESYFSTYPPSTDHVQPYRNPDGQPTFEFTFAIPLEPHIGFDPLKTEMEDRANIWSDHFPAHPSGDPWLYTGRFDMLGEYSGRPCVRDEKTTGSSIGSSWSDQWDLRNQFIGYTWACQQLGIDLDTVVVRGIAIQKTQIVHAEAIKVYSDSLRARWLEQLHRDLWRLRRAYDEDYWDFNLADVCSAYGGCVFKNACAAPDPAPWLENFEIRHWNPLNKNPVEEKPL